MKLMWTGSDVLFATKFLKHSKKSKWPYMLGMRIFAKMADLFVQEHYIVSEHLRSELEPLKLKKPINILVDPPQHKEKYYKRKHLGFNILYYRPVDKKKNQKFLDWVYGYDIFLKIKKSLGQEGFHFIETKGDLDMTKIYPIVDFYLRPNRHDGASRMIMECDIQEIPYYWSSKDPSVEDAVERIKEEKWRSTYTKPAFLKRNDKHLFIEDMKKEILRSLSEAENGFGLRKFSISRKTEIPEDILTVLLKQLKIDGKIELVTTFSERTGMPNGSAYQLKEDE